MTYYITDFLSDEIVGPFKNKDALIEYLIERRGDITLHETKRAATYDLEAGNE